MFWEVTRQQRTIFELADRSFRDARIENNTIMVGVLELFFFFSTGVGCGYLVRRERREKKSILTFGKRKCINHGPLEKQN